MIVDFSRLGSWLNTLQLFKFLSLFLSLRYTILYGPYLLAHLRHIDFYFGKEMFLQKAPLREHQIQLVAKTYWRLEDYCEFRLPFQTCFQF